jgi:predicted amidohydrolase
MSNTLTIAIVQANLVWEDIALNITCFTHTLKTIKGKVDIVILPEMFTTGFSMNANKFAQTMQGDTVNWMQRMATEMGFALCGSIIIEEGSKYYNRFIFTTPEGEIFTYDKRHLFTFAKEDKYYTKGSKRLIFDYKGWRILPQICYDVRFPIWSRNRNDYDLIINVANFPAERRDAWIILNKARAIENQCFVAAANRVGKGARDIYYSGDSMILDMLGQPVATALTGQEEVIVGTITLDSIKQFREDFPVMPDADAFTLL